MASAAAEGRLSKPRVAVIRGCTAQGTWHSWVRIFTPSYEMPFAGHPTLGTAHVCRALGLGGNGLTLEMTAGVIPVTAEIDEQTGRPSMLALSVDAEKRVRVSGEVIELGRGTVTL